MEAVQEKERCGGSDESKEHIRLRIPSVALGAEEGIGGFAEDDGDEPFDDLVHGAHEHAGAEDEKRAPPALCNDAKAERGSKLDRHEHIGQGTIGVEPFRRLLNDKRFAHAAFIAETPVDEPGDEERNVRVLKSLVKK